MAAARVLLLLAVALVAGAALFGRHHCRHGQFGRRALVLAPAASDSPAPTCDSLDCPPYRAVYNESDFEIRDYRAAAWVETDALLDVSFNKAGVTGFRRLFKYIQGDNVEGAQVPMTAPVLTTIKPSGGPFCSSTFTVRFFVPPQFSEKPPAPTEGSGVHVAHLPRRCVAIRRFPGFASDFNVAQEVQALAESLATTAWANVTSMGGDDKGGEVYSIAQYNSPFELFNRVNEVWVPFEGNADCLPTTIAEKAAAAAADVQRMLASERIHVHADPMFALA